MEKHSLKLTFINTRSPLIQQTWQHLKQNFSYELFDSMDQFLAQGVKKRLH